MLKTWSLALDGRTSKGKTLLVKRIESPNLYFVNRGETEGMYLTEVPSCKAISIIRAVSFNERFELVALSWQESNKTNKKQL
jgi:hypothetical protein